MRHVPCAPDRRYHQQASLVESPHHLLGWELASLWGTLRGATQDVRSDSEARALYQARQLSFHDALGYAAGGIPIRHADSRRIADTTLSGSRTNRTTFK